MGKKPKTATKPADSYHHGSLRQALINAGLAEIEHSGPDGISLAGLAKSLGVSQAAPYRHFADKDALLAALAEEGFKAFSAALQKAAEMAGPKRKLHGMVQAYADFGLTRPGLYRLMFASRILAAVPKESTLHQASAGSFQLLVNALPTGLSMTARLRQAMKIWVGLHGAVMLAQQGMLTGGIGGMTVQDVLADIIK